LKIGSGANIRKQFMDRPGRGSIRFPRSVI